MSERLLSRSDQLGESLVEWRDPRTSAVEWFIESERGAEVLFRWDGVPNENASFAPGSRSVCPIYSDLPNLWKVDLVPLEQPVHQLCRDWPAEFFTLWLDQCREWSPGFVWTPGSWREDFLGSTLPWLSRLDVRRLNVPAELRTLVQADTLDHGLQSLGFTSIGKKLRRVVLQELQRDLVIQSESRDEVALCSTLWATRCSTWLRTDDLYGFWDVVGATEDSFLHLLQLWRPKIAKKLKLAFRKRPEFGEWKSSLARFAGVQDPTLNMLYLPFEQEEVMDETFSWSREEFETFERSFDQWQTRLPLSLGEVRKWGKMLGNCLRKAGSRTYHPSRSTLVGLFRAGRLVALSEWSLDGRLLQWSRSRNAPLTAEQRHQFCRLLPEMAWEDEARVVTFV